MPLATTQFISLRLAYGHTGGWWGFVMQGFSMGSFGCATAGLADTARMQAALAPMMILRNVVVMLPPVRVGDMAVAGGCSRASEALA